MKHPKTLATTLLAFLLSAATMKADITLPAVLGSNMVLQRGQKVPIWGWAAPGERVRVEFGGQTRSAKADTAGRWEVRLGAMKASDVPSNLVVEGANRIVLTNIVVGEVWLCSGQSNMEKPIGQQPGQRPVLNHEKELAGSDYPGIRLFRVNAATGVSPVRDVKSLGWHLCNSNSNEKLRFSAAAYFFGRELHRELGVPVGLIVSAVGGTRIEPWTPPVGFDAVKGLAAQIDPVPAEGRVTAQTPTALYNGMIAPLVPFALRGAIWYQGESNTIDIPDGPVYADKMKALIAGWRKTWGQGDFPFYYVQLAPYCYFSDRDTPRAPDAEALPEIWEAQTAALAVRHTGMVVTTDLVDDLKDIHPVNKLDVGRRLARLALARSYGRKDIVASGPMFRDAIFSAGRAVVSFDHADGGLVSRDGQPLDWFTICGRDGRFVPATAVIEGVGVVVSSPAVPEPKAVRFGWHEKATPNLFNGAGLPAAPFRSDRPEMERGGAAARGQAYLFSYFVGNGEDGLHLAWSRDGYEWKALKNGESYLTPMVGESKLMRDPCLIRGPDGIFHMVWTTAWQGKTIGHATSKDLLTWSEQTAIPVMAHEPGTMNCWAPEIFWDADRGHFLIFWATTIPGHFPEGGGTAEGKTNHRIYCTTTRDFKSFKPTRLLFEQGFNVIDATLLPAKGKYHLIVKDERLKPEQKNLRIAVGRHPDGPFSPAGEPFTRHWVEGPTSLKVGDDYLVYFDAYRDNRYEVLKSRDLKTWEDVSAKLSMPKGIRHGSALPVPISVVRKLLEAAPAKAVQPPK